LKPGVTPTIILIYSLSEKEFKTFREYIEKNVAKEYIRPSKLLVRYLVLFVPKKNGKLRIYVDYRKLNDIIIKNRYTLLLIYEI
jgi:exoribonuclease II